MLMTNEEIKLAVKMIRQDMSRRDYISIGDAFDNYNFIWFDNMLTDDDFDKVFHEYEKQLLKEGR